MSEVSDMLKRYKEIRQRLTFPPNAVPDTGINLKRQEEWRPAPSQQLQDLPQVEHKYLLSSQPPFKLKQITLASTVGEAARAFGMDISQLKTRSRKPRYVLPRQVAIYVATKKGRWSVSKIAHFLDLDHTTALHANKTIAHKIESDVELKSCVEHIEHKLEALYPLTNAAECQQHLEEGQKRENLPEPTIPTVD